MIDIDTLPYIISKIRFNKGLLPCFQTTTLYFLFKRAKNVFDISNVNFLSIKRSCLHNDFKYFRNIESPSQKTLFSLQGRVYLSLGQDDILTTQLEPIKKAEHHVVVLSVNKDLQYAKVPICTGTKIWLRQ